MVWYLNVQMKEILLNRQMLRLLYSHVLLTLLQLKQKYVIFNKVYNKIFKFKIINNLLILMLQEFKLWILL